MDMMLKLHVYRVDKLLTRYTCNFAKLFAHFVGIVQGLIAFPACAYLRVGKIPVWSHLARHLSQVLPQILCRRSSPKPVAIINLVDDQTWLQHERMGNHWIVMWIGVLLNIKVLLHLTPRVGEKGPLGTHRISELICFQDVIGRNSDDLRVCNSDSGIELGQFKVLLMILRTVMAS